jgi:hypothetical protein
MNQSLNAADCSQLFDDSDIQLLKRAVLMVPDLEAAAYLTKIIKDKVRFPINDRDEIEKFVEDSGGAVMCKGRKWNRKDVKRFLKPSLFPIGDEEQLLGSMFFAISAGTSYHYYERKAMEMLDRAGSAQYPPIRTPAR